MLDLTNLLVENRTRANCLACCGIINKEKEVWQRCAGDKQEVEGKVAECGSGKATVTSLFLWLSTFAVCHRNRR